MRCRSPKRTANSFLLGTLRTATASKLLWPFAREGSTAKWLTLLGGFYLGCTRMEIICAICGLVIFSPRAGSQGQVRGICVTCLAQFRADEIARMRRSRFLLWMMLGLMVAIACFP